jgi:hypothetical protein
MERRCLRSVTVFAFGRTFTGSTLWMADVLLAILAYYAILITASAFWYL